MAIKVLSKKIMGTRVVSGSVCVVTGFVTRNNWFNATSNLGFQRSFVTITLRKKTRAKAVSNASSCCIRKKGTIVH
uniref:Uncharacterized protein n=1 Tax=Vitis vinifera TaxID=29760 RepID=F6HN61_VITVI